MGRDSLSSYLPPAMFGKPRASVVALPFAILLLATPATSQMVSGRVVRASDNTAVNGVTVALIDTLAGIHRGAVNDATGEFVIVFKAAGAYQLQASRPGYATIQTRPVEIGDGEVVELELRLDESAVPSEPLTVVGRRRENPRESDLRQYFERVELYGERHLGSIQIYTRDSLQKWDAFILRDVFRFYIRWGPYGSGCNPKTFLDGGRRSLQGDLGFMSVSRLEGIELYAGGGPAQGRFWDPDGCGVILAWSRLQREGASKRRAAELLVVGAVAALLTLQAVFLIF